MSPKSVAAFTLRAAQLHNWKYGEGGKARPTILGVNLRGRASDHWRSSSAFFILGRSSSSGWG